SGGGGISQEGEVEQTDDRPSLPPWAGALYREVQNRIQQLRQSPETNPIRATSLPDRVVIWVDSHGPHLNVWIDQAVGSISLQEEESTETTLDRITETVRHLQDERDPNQSIQVVDEIEQTGIRPDETEGIDGNAAQVHHGPLLTEEQLTS